MFIIPWAWFMPYTSTMHPNLYTSCESKSTSKAPYERNTCPAPVESVVLLLHLQGGTLQISQFDMNPENGGFSRPNLSYQASRRGQWLAPPRKAELALLKESEKKGGTHVHTCPPTQKKTIGGTKNLLHLKGSSFYQQFLEFMLGSKGVDESHNLCTYLGHMTPGQKYLNNLYYM